MNLRKAGENLRLKDIPIVDIKNPKEEDFHKRVVLHELAIFPNDSATLRKQENL